jgi:DNA modification methylase
VTDEQEAVLWPAGVDRTDDPSAETKAAPPAVTAQAPDGASYFLAQGDAVGWLRTLPDESIDLMVTDPPYESLEKHRAVGTTTRLSHSKSSSNDWFTVFPNARFPELFAEVHRVLKKNAHFYLYCDQETAFVAKPDGEAAGFKFWKPLVWDKCLAPETLVCTARGVVPIGDLTTADRVFTPDGRLVAVLAARRSRSTALRVALSDGTSIVSSEDHIFIDESGVEIEAKQLAVGSRLRTSSIGDPERRAEPREARLALGELLDDDEAVLQLPDGARCLFCQRELDGVRAASAHRASWSFDEQRTTLNISSTDLAHFALREIARDAHATLRPFANTGRGGFRVRSDPRRVAEPITVAAIDDVGETELVDIAIDDDRQLYVLANGLVTHNCAIGMGYHYRSRYELILFFEKGKRKLNDLGIADVIRAKRIHRGYPTEKPVEVSRILIEQSSQPGELVVDPFMGTASAGVAALLGGRSFAGSDISDKSLVIANERLMATGATKLVGPPWAARDKSMMEPAQLALGLSKKE